MIAMTLRRMPCSCPLSHVEAMARALETAANGDPALLLKARVHIAKHMERHRLPDDESQALERRITDRLRPALKAEGEAF